MFFLWQTNCSIMRIGMVFLPGWRTSWLTGPHITPEIEIQEGMISIKMVSLNLKGKTEAEINTIQSSLMTI